MSKNKNKHPLERGSKAIKIFTTLKTKQKGKFIKDEKTDPRLAEHDDHESHLEQLNRDAMKSLQLPVGELERRDYGYDFSGAKRLDLDYYIGE